MRKSITWELRRLGGDGEVFLRGTYGGDLSLDTANRMITTKGWRVTISNSGHARLNTGACDIPVSLHFIVDIAATEKGQTALREYRIAELARQAEIEAMESEIADVIENLGAAEALRRLKS